MDNRLLFSPIWDNTDVRTRLRGVMDSINYNFSRYDLYWEAIQTDASHNSNSGGRPLAEGNLRIALIGKFAMKLVLTEQAYAQNKTTCMWFESFPGALPEDS